MSVDVQKWPSHTQCLDSGKMVTKEPVKYFSEKRNGAVRLQQNGRQLFEVECKQELAKMTKFLNLGFRISKL